MESKARGEAEGGAHHDVAPEAVPDGHHRAAGLGARRLGDGQQVVDVAPEVHDAAVPGALVAPPVVGQRGELGEPAHGQPEAVAPVERSVDEHDGARTRVRTAGRGREVEGGRIGHGQGRRYLDCP